MIKKTKINIGEIAFADVNSLDTWKVKETEQDICVSQSYENIVKSNNDNNDIDMIIAVKYLGNGIFEEMLTSERMLIEGLEIELEDHSENIATNLGVIIEMDSGFMEIDLDSSMNDVINKLENIKRISQQFPLILSDGATPLYEIDEISKREYLTSTDEQRRTIISKTKAFALEQNAKFGVQVDDVIKRFNLNNETINMAYLENQLFDFENKGKIK